MSIQYIHGDATNPIGEGNKIIVHVCNDVGAWGAGFVLALSAKWTEPERRYRLAGYESGWDYSLGWVQFVQVEPTIWVANLIGQHDIKPSEDGIVPIRYEAIEQGLRKIAAEALRKKASVHMPRIGCGLAGGSWDRIEPLISSSLLEYNVDVVVYDWP